MFAQVRQPDFASNAVAGEVDNDVIAFCNTLLVQLSQYHKHWQQVAVIGDLDHTANRHSEPDLEEAGNAGVQDAEAIFTALHFKVRFVAKVHGHHVADEIRRVEDVEVELAVCVPCFVSEHQVDVIIQVAPRICRAAGQAEVYAVIDCFIATIQGAVEVEHGSVAFVHVLRSEAEHVIMEPVRGHGFMPVAGDPIDSTAVIRAAGFRIRGIHVDAVMTRENDRPVIIIELSREEECAGEAVVLRAVVAVVLVRRNGVASKTTVLALHRRAADCGGGK